MDEDGENEEVSFVPESIEPLVYDAIEAVLKDKNYSDVHVQAWVDEICSRITGELIDMKRPFKYITSCSIMQKNGAGLHSSHSAYWDSANDNVVTARWPSEKRKDPNARVVCLVQVFGISH
jgi:dynein light chain Tctex-type 1